MFCKNCGEKLLDDAQFCPNCGIKLDKDYKFSDNSTKKSFVSDVDIFNRDVLISYLYHVRSMEFSLNKLYQDYNSLDKLSSHLGVERYISAPVKMGMNIDFELIFGAVIIGIAFIVAGGFLHSLIPWGIFTLAQVVGIIIIVGAILSQIMESSSNESMYEKKLADYEREVEKDKERVKRELSEKATLLSQQQEYKGWIVEAEEVLDKLYKINIVPSQFRNIYAIYYLYEYLSTSQFSLESAMLHFNLEEIKSRLDRIIAQQQQMILLQMKQLAQTEKLVKQNDKLIEQAIATERNTHYAMQYSEVAALNSNVIAFTNTVMSAIILDAK